MFYLINQNGKKKTCFEEPLEFKTFNAAAKYVRALPNVLETQFPATFLRQDSVTGVAEELTITEETSWNSSYM